VGRKLDPGQLDALIVSGGDDIHPTLYGEEEMPTATYDPARDELEREYIRHALQNGLPLLGICRGYQLINVVLGGTLYTDIRPLRKATSNRATVLPRKTVKLCEESIMAQILGRSELRVNSLHQQAVHRVAEKLEVAAADLDDFVQALEHSAGQSVLGVQWHPEYLFYLPSQLRLFRWLVQRALPA